MAKRDFYEVLGVDRNADADALKKAYRKLAIQYHPDRQQGKSDAEKKDAEEKFKEAAEAYDVLSNPDKRARYDQLGPEGYDQMNGGGAGINKDDIAVVHQFSRFGADGALGMGRLEGTLIIGQESGYRLFGPDTAVYLFHTAVGHQLGQITAHSVHGDIKGCLKLLHRGRFVFRYIQRHLLQASGFHVGTPPSELYK